jgi:hypothetical protein
MSDLVAFLRALGAWIERTGEDIHAGMIAGFDRLWYGR